ncbi:MAG: hypothetical protein IH585_18165, partial [Anaerolineaceae bacterium]|nr:hypothetical protein [Anaerolineaceae bacterium]
MKIVTIATILMLLLGGGISTVAAQTSLPGDVLYPVKNLVEDIELGLTTNPDVKFQIASQHANQRFLEIQTMIENGEIVPEPFFFEWQMQLCTALEYALQSGDPTGSLLMVQQMLQQQTMQANKGEQTGEPIMNLFKNTLQNQANLVDAGIAEPDKLASELDYMATFKKQNGKQALEESWESLYLADAQISGDDSSGEIPDDYQFMYMTGKIVDDDDDGQDGNNNHQNSGDNENGDGNDSSGGQN